MGQWNTAARVQFQSCSSARIRAPQPPDRAHRPVEILPGWPSRCSSTSTCCCARSTDTPSKAPPTDLRRSPTNRSCAKAYLRCDDVQHGRLRADHHRDATARREAEYGKGTVRMVTRAIVTARVAGATGAVVVREDSAYGTRSVISACLPRKCTSRSSGPTTPRSNARSTRSPTKRGSGEASGSGSAARTPECESLMPRSPKPHTQLLLPTRLRSLLG